MQLGTRVIDQKCARCYEPVTIPAYYEYGMWFHQRCVQTGEHLLANATRLANALSSPYLHFTEQELS